MNYILYGEQYPMIKKRLKKVLDERLGEVDDFNVVKFDYAPDKIDEIIDEASMLPLGYEAKAVVIDNASILEPKSKEQKHY
jgi:DNA polymerase III delta subunit